MSACDCYRCSMKGQGARGCFECTDCGLDSLTMLAQDDDSGRLYCEECWRDDSAWMVVRLPRRYDRARLH